MAIKPAPPSPPAAGTELLPDDALALEPGRGVYDADRAAALAGVPRSTLHYWARTGLYAPSISRGPPARLWSWADLLALRAIDWLRRGGREGGAPNATRIAPISTRRIRQAVEQLAERGIPHDRLSGLVSASPAGELYLQFPDGVTVRAVWGQQAALPDLLSLVRPYNGGPNLLRPRPLLRIIPGKLHGEPHVVDTRISSATLYAFEEAGYTTEQVQRMYPDVSPEALDQALDLERSLRVRSRRAA